MFDRVDFREDEKKRRENKEGKLFGGCLVGRERWENNGVFFPNPPKSFLLKGRENLMEKNLMAE